MNKAAKYIINNERRFIEIFIIFLMSVIIYISILSDYGCIPLFNEFTSCFVIQFADKDNLLLSLFGIQASISIGSIAIITIVSGLSNKKIYGISVTEYITTLKPVYLKHNRLIILNLILIVLNYLSISFLYYNLSLAIFLTVIIITTVFVKDVYLVFKDSDKLHKEIQEYVLKNYNNFMLEKIQDSINNALITDNTLTFIENISILKLIYEEELDDKEWKRTNLIDSIEILIVDIVSQLALRKDYKKMNYLLDCICGLYRIANSTRKEQSPFNVRIWVLIHNDFYQTMENISYEELIANDIHTKLHNNLLINQNNTSLYFTKFYESIINNNSINPEQRNNILYLLIPHFKYYFENKTVTLSRPSLILDLCHLSINVLNYEDEKYCNSYLRRLTFYSTEINSNDFSIVFLIILIYLYDYFKIETFDYYGSKNKLTKILKDFKYDIEVFIQNINCIELCENYISIFDTLKSISFSKISSCSFEEAGEEFLLFLFMNKFHDIEIISGLISIISNGDIISLYNRLTPTNHQSKTEDLFKLFESTFVNENENITSFYSDYINNKMILLITAFNNLSKNQLIEERKKSKANQEEINKFIEKAENDLKWFIENEFDNLTIQNTKNAKQTEKIQIIDEIIWQKNFKNSSTCLSYIDGIQNTLLTILKERNFKKDTSLSISIECYDISEDELLSEHFATNYQHDIETGVFYYAIDNIKIPFDKEEMLHLINLTYSKVKIALTVNENE